MSESGALARLMAKVDRDDAGCWNWTASASAGYGRFWFDGRLALAHRISYELHVAPIPAGMHIDHLCGNTLCVNPAHLAVVLPAENIHRSANRAATNRRKTSCIQGHAFDENNTYTTPDGRRQCRTCNAARSARLARKG